MAIDYELTLPEEMLLLALKDEKGTPAASMYAYGLAGAVLAELFLRGRLRAVERRRGEPLAEATGTEPIGDTFLDGAFDRIRAAKRRATLSTWVGRLAGRDLLHGLARGLSQRGILRMEERKILLVFSRKVYPELDPAPERRLVERLRHAVFHDDEVDGRTAALVAIAYHAGILAPVLGRKALKPRKARIEELGRSAAVSDATRAAIEAVQAAVIAATTAATMAAT